jgi:predicted esterase
MNQPEELDFVHTFLPGRSARTLLLLHGTGDEKDLIPLGRELDPDANLLILRGKPLENGPPRFFTRLTEGIFAAEDLIRRTHELADFIEQASAKYRLNRQNLFAVGYANGANIAGNLLLLRPQTLAGAILLRPMGPTLLDLSGVPARPVSGRYDPARAEVRGPLENGGHGLTGATVKIVRRWLENLTPARQYLHGAQRVLAWFGRLSVVLRREDPPAKPQAMRSSRRPSQIVRSNFGKLVPDDDGHALAPPFVGIWIWPSFIARFDATTDERHLVGREQE